MGWLATSRRRSVRPGLGPARPDPVPARDRLSARRGDRRQLGRPGLGSAANCTCAGRWGRVKGQGLVARRPKSLAGERVLGLPSWLVNLLAERRAQVGEVTPMFPDSRLAGIATRTMSSGTTVGYGAGRRLSGWCRTPTGRRLQPCLTGRVSVPGPSLTSSGHARISMTQDVVHGSTCRRPGGRCCKASHHPRVGDDDPRRAGRGLGDYSFATVTAVDSCAAARERRSAKAAHLQFVGPVGLEPTTHGLKVRCSAS